MLSSSWENVPLSPHSFLFLSELWILSSLSRLTAFFFFSTCCLSQFWYGGGRTVVSSPFSTQLSKIFVVYLLGLVRLFCNPMDCSPPGSSVGGILQARILECVAMPFSRGSSWPRDGTLVSCTAGRCLPSEPPGKPVGGSGHCQIQLAGGKSCWRSCSGVIDQDPKGPSPDRPSLQSSALAPLCKRRLGNSIWCKFPDLFCKCENPPAKGRC